MINRFVYRLIKTWIQRTRIFSPRNHRKIRLFCQCKTVHHSALKILFMSQLFLINLQLSNDCSQHWYINGYIICGLDITISYNMAKEYEQYICLTNNQLLIITKPCHPVLCGFLVCFSTESLDEQKNTRKKHSRVSRVACMPMWPSMIDSFAKNTSAGIRECGLLNGLQSHI